ncbi:unnamed protein product [Ceratitis capitata]|nr:unnamed protein product [Ceratitis capitata]
MAKAIVCEDCTLVGDITISPGCVIHPSASIIAEAGPIVLGENCIVEEYATIAFRLPVGNKIDPSADVRTLNIGPNNVFEVGCKVEACHIGEKNVFESKCYVGPCVFVSSGCIIGAGVNLVSEQNYQKILLFMEEIVFSGRPLISTGLKHYKLTFCGRYCQTITTCENQIMIQKKYG